MADDKITADDSELEDGKPVAPVAPAKDEEESDESGTGEPLKTEIPAPVEEKEEVIPVRQSVQQHIIARQKQTIQKLRSRDDDAGRTMQAADDEDDSLDPSTRAQLERVVDKRLSPVLETFASNADEIELKNLITAEPGAAKYEKSIRAYMQHPAYKQVPPSMIYQSLAFKDAEATGAKRKKVADIEAGHMRGGGTSRRPTSVSRGSMPTPDEINEMDDATFDSFQDRVRQGEFVQK